MAKAKFGIADIMNAKSKAAGLNDVKEYTEIWLSPYEVKPSESNFYSQEKIEELADSFLAVGQQQPTVLGRINGEFRIVSGHRRNLANIMNIERGHEGFKKVRYLYKDMTEAIFELSLLVGNAFNRELTAWEKTQQAQRLKEALLRAKEEDSLEITGKLRDIIAKLLNESPTNIARMDSINNNATPEIKEEFAKGSIGVTTAYEAAKLPEDDQKVIAEKAAAGEKIRAKEIAQKVAEKKTEERKKGEVSETDTMQNAEHQQIPGQMELERNFPEYCPEESKTESAPKELKIKMSPEEPEAAAGYNTRLEYMKALTVDEYARYIAEAMQKGFGQGFGRLTFRQLATEAFWKSWITHLVDETGRIIEER